MWVLTQAQLREIPKKAVMTRNSRPPNQGAVPRWQLHLLTHRNITIFIIGIASFSLFAHIVNGVNKYIVEDPSIGLIILPIVIYIVGLFLIFLILWGFGDRKSESDRKLYKKARNSLLALGAFLLATASAVGILRGLFELNLDSGDDFVSYILYHSLKLLCIAIIMVTGANIYVWHLRRSDQ